MSKPDARRLSHTLCFSCGEIFPASGGEKLLCRKCGFSVGYNSYYKIMNYAMHTVYYGYYYRRAYEEQLFDEGDITTHYALIDPSDLACFLAVSALSGIIGNLAYDLIKKAIHAINQKFRTLGCEIDQSLISLSSEKDIIIFIQYIQEFHSDSEQIPSKIKRAILEEIISWEVADMFSKHNPQTKEEIKDILRKAFLNINNINKPSRKDFINFWKQLKKSTIK